MLLQLDQVQKKIDGTLILPNINLKIAGGKIIGLLGPNGSGKTTLLKLISGLNMPTHGTLLLDDQPYHYNETAQQINYLPDNLIFPLNYKVADALEFYCDNFIDFDLNKALVMLQDLQIDSLTTLRNMSKGQQERLMLTLVLARNTKLTLLDEPLAAIDVITRDEILRIIKQYLNRDTSVIISTHLIFDMQDLFDEVIFIQNGNIVLYQSVAQIHQQTGENLLTFYRNYFRI